MTPRFRSWPIGLAAAAAVATGSAATAAPVAPVLRFQALTRREVSDAQAAGVGCAWSLPGERAMRFAAADDHAAIKLGGRVIRLRPAEGARDMFPFTYDAWTDGDLRLTVAKASNGRRRGGVVDTRTVLTIATGGRGRSVAGEMECGD